MRKGDGAVWTDDWPAGSLHAAVRDGDEGAVVRLLSEGADPDRVVAEQTPLHVACDWWRPRIVRILLAAGADPDSRGPRGWTPLAAALRRSSDQGGEIVVLLLEAGADPDATNDVGDTPRKFAAGLDSFVRTDLSRFFERPS